MRLLASRRELLMLLTASVQVRAAEQTPAFSLIQDVGIDQQLGSQLDLNLTFRDESGATVPLSSYFHGKPVILAPVYYMCSSLCPMTLNSLIQSLRVLKFNAGNDFEVIAFSFDPKETPEMAAAAKARFVKEYNRPGTSRASIF